MEEAFLIEIKVAGSAMYLYQTPCKQWVFTTDSIKATKFQTKDDAQWMAIHQEIDNYAITQHQWGG